MAEFKPSIHSFGPGELELRKIKHMRAALDKIEAAVVQGHIDSFPRWIDNRINTCAAELETVISFIDVVERRSSKPKRGQ